MRRILPYVPSRGGVLSHVTRAGVCECQRETCFVLWPREPGARVTLVYGNRSERDVIFRGAAAREGRTTSNASTIRIDIGGSCWCYQREKGVFPERVRTVELFGVSTILAAGHQPGRNRVKNAVVCPDAAADIHAARLNVGDGDLVRLTSAAGADSLVAQVSATVLPGAPFASINALNGSAIFAAGLPDLKACAVRLEKMDEAN